MSSAKGVPPRSGLSTGHACAEPLDIRLDGALEEPTHDSVGLQGEQAWCDGRRGGERLKSSER